VIYVLDATGTVTATLPQPVVHSTSAWGMRDLCTDGTNIAGGSEAGISILTPTGALATTWNGQPVVQPITGAMLATLGVPRGLAWDGQAGGGSGRFYGVNFDSGIVEFDLHGNITGTFANKGWNGAGLAFDSATGNLWIDACPARGDIAEIDRSGGTWSPTGRRIPRAVAGSFEGGLSEAAVAAGHHAPWASTLLLANVCQGYEDTLAVQRIDLWPQKRGFDEVRLDIGVNGGPLDPAIKTFGVLDTLVLQLTDPTSAANGQPTWTLMNFSPEAEVDDLTDVSSLGLGLTILPEHRTLNPLGIAQPALIAMILSTGIGAPFQLPVGPGVFLPPDFLVRVQAFWFDTTAPHLIVSTNEAYWRGGDQQTGIVVEAVGPTSYAPDAQRGFWRIMHQGGYPAIQSVTLDWSTTAQPGQSTMVFDIDEDLGGRRHDLGNATSAGCQGTYRNGSDAWTGLDYGFAGNLQAGCAVGTENSGFTVDFGTPTAATSLTYRFQGGLFVVDKAIEFDCDTDGGLGVSGAAMRGLRVHVVLVDSTQLSGTLALDPKDPLRSFVRL
jgi:hypothetical protein